MWNDSDLLEHLTSPIVDVCHSLGVNKSQTAWTDSLATPSARLCEIVTMYMYLLMF